MEMDSADIRELVGSLAISHSIKQLLKELKYQVRNLINSEAAFSANYL